MYSLDFVSTPTSLWKGGILEESWVLILLTYHIETKLPRDCWNN